MKRTGLGVIVGLTVWGLFLVVSDYAWEVLSPDWFGKSQQELRFAVSNNSQFTPQTSILVIVVIRSAVYSIISGILTAMISRDNGISTLVLGTVLLILGTVVHWFFWLLVPFWFHFSILLMFMPLTMLGGKLIRRSSNRPKWVSD